MGCNQSKSNDIAADRAQRRRLDGDAVAPNSDEVEEYVIPRTTAVSPIKGADDNATTDDALEESLRLGTSLDEIVCVSRFDTFRSYTDQRMGEDDYFQGIIDQTASRLIDVSAQDEQRGRSASGTSLPGVDAEHSYSNLLMMPPSPDTVERLQLLQLPLVEPNAADPETIRHALEEPPPQSAQFGVLLDELCKRVTSMHVADCGQLVVPFPRVH